MKFAAILRDSLREAIDYKVFYVLVALSLLLALLAASLSFTPTAGGREVVEHYALLPLQSDYPSLDASEALGRAFSGRPVRFGVDSVSPAEGETDAEGDTDDTDGDDTTVADEAA